MIEWTNNTMEAPFFLSAEIRWFIKGDIPPELKNWYNRSPHKYEFQARTDTYLLFPNTETVGVKFREGRFEIKSLVRVIEKFNWGDHIRGEIEQWEKWSLAGNSVSQLFNDVIEDKPAWIDVNKTRTIRKYTNDGVEIHEMDASGQHGYPADGCNVELTEITINDTSFWSIGFEAFATKKDLKNNLLQTLDLFFGSSDIDLRLEEKESFSYPTLLANLSTNKLR